MDKEFGKLRGNSTARSFCCDAAFSLERTIHRKKSWNAKVATDSLSQTDTEVIRQILQTWAETTRTGQLDQVLAHHEPNALIYDVPSPMKYEGIEAYRKSWGEWHPETPADGQFQLRDLVITAGKDTAFAHAFIQCGGTAPDGKVFSDTVRATFCLQKHDGSWWIQHQHISKPLSLKSSWIFRTEAAINQDIREHG